jgi:adenine-specific DNA-methyltransferase
MQNLLNDLTKLLDDCGEFTDENGKLLKNKVVEYAIRLDSGLLRLLLKNKTIKNHFFTEVDGLLVFDKIKFQSFVSNKEFLPGSYTAFKNKIGLADEKGDFISSSGKVTLVWPYKDCVLEGGQTKEDQKRDEIFWNETLALDEIYRLFAPKVITNWKRIDSKGEHILSGNEKIDFDKENFIIKGNNLLVLHSIYKRFAGKVKLIYIDPPYNTGKDSFKYNDKFNHSTWLSFMKNRLEIAKMFLRKDGVIFVHCDNNEQAYLKALMDDIFHRENFIETISVVNNPGGRDYGGIANMHEFIHVYSASLDYKIYNLPDPEKNFPYTDNIGGFEARELRNRNVKFNDKNRPNLCYPFYVNPKKTDANGFLEISLEKKPGFIELYPVKSQGIQTVWRWGREKVLENLNINIVGKLMENGFSYMIVEKYRKKERMARSVWFDKEVNSQRGTLHLKSLFGKKLFDHAKPEETLARILQIGSQEDDMVMDFFAGSGTTGAAAHKMNRRYILIEQMDYIHDLTEARLKKVAEGEQGGISKSVNWRGGGSFIYCELMEWNEAWMTKIQKAKTTSELKAIWKEMSKNAYLNYYIDAEAVNDNISDFGELSLKEQKQILVETLDKNCLYVDYSEIKDKDYNVSEVDIKLNAIFYQEK